METKENLEKIERKISPLYKYPSVKTIWITNSSQKENENMICVSMIINDTRKGYMTELKEINRHIKYLENMQTPKYIFNTYKLSEYWNKLVSADPKLYAEMRVSIILYDPAGFFAPLKVLLLEGKIPCTRESAYNLLVSAPDKIMRVHKEIKLDILTKIYNLVIDAGQAPLVLKGFDPPIPKALPDALHSAFPHEYIIKKDIEVLRSIITYYKDIEHGRISIVSSDNLHVFLEASEIFIKDMEELMKKIAKQDAITHYNTLKSTTTR